MPQIGKMHASMRRSGAVSFAPKKDVAISFRKNETNTDRVIASAKERISPAFNISP